MNKPLTYLTAAALAVALCAGSLLDGPDAEAAVAADLQDATAQAAVDAEQARLEKILHGYAHLAGSKQ